MQTYYAEHTKILQQLYAYNSDLSAICDHTKTEYIFDRNIEICFPKKEDWENNLQKVNYYSHTYFCDGSVRKNGSGYGVLHAQQHRVIKGSCGKRATTVQTEIAAISACCIDAIREQLSGNICKYTDSQNALKSYRTNSKLVQECIQLLETLSINNNVIITWLPAHVGLYGNGVAVKIAKYAATEIYSGPAPFLANHRTSAKEVNNVCLKQQIKATWRAVRGCEHTKLFIEEIGKSAANELINMTKNDLRIVTGFLTGHCKLNTLLIGIRNDPDCDLCGRNSETAKHILCDCENLTTIRERVYNVSTLDTKQVCKQSLHNIIQLYKKGSTQYHHIARAF